MTPQMLCVCCQSKDVAVHVKNPKDREYYVKRSIPSRYLACKQCKTIFQEPLPSSDEVSKFYHEGYQNYTNCSSTIIRQLFLLGHKMAAKSFLKKFSQEAFVLDFGCNQGLFLNSLAELGSKNLYGFDVVRPSDKYINAFQFIQDLDELQKSGKKFDVIRMNHVIEHLPNLDEQMIRLSSLLRPNGRIIGQTPNAGHYTARLFLSYWGPLHFPYHLQLFSREALQFCANRWSLRLTKFCGTFQPTGWSMSFENFLKLFFSPQRTGRSKVYPLLLMSSIPFVFLDLILSRSCSTPIIDFELSKL